MSRTRTVHHTNVLYSMTRKEGLPPYPQLNDHGDAGIAFVVCGGGWTFSAGFIISRLSQVDPGRSPRTRDGHARGQGRQRRGQRGHRWRSGDGPTNVAHSVRHRGRFRRHRHRLRSSGGARTRQQRVVGVVGGGGRRR